MSAARSDGWDLIEAAQSGDREAFGRLYSRYAPGVSRFVGSRLRDRDLAQDLTSETFARALRRIDSVSYQGRDAGAWFTTIARNLITDHVKSSRVQRETVTAESTTPVPIRTAPSMQ
jgi:RNA polymerase sigma-70 factor (ECF subfamily)